MLVPSKASRVIQGVTAVFVGLSGCSTGGDDSEGSPTGGSSGSSRPAGGGAAGRLSSPDHANGGSTVGAGAAGTLTSPGHANGGSNTAGGAGSAASGGSATGIGAGGTGGGRAGSNAGGNPASAGGEASGGASPDIPGACGTIATFEEGKSPSMELHVATTGRDDTGDGTAQRPFASIERALDQATPGAAVRIHAGTYPGGAYVENLAGSAAAPIWIGGVPGEARPVIEGGGTAVHFVRARWVIVHDLEVREQTDNGINADDGDERADADASHALIFRNLDIHDVGSGGNQDCLKLSGINAYFVLDSRFARCGGGSSGSAIDHVGCHDGLIARNAFSDLSGGNAVQCKGGSRNIEVRWNRITSGGQRAVNLGGSTGFEFFRPPLSSTDDNAEASDIRVIANVIEGGIAALGFVGCIDCLAANNTIVDPERWIVRILQETTSSGDYAFLAAQNGRFVNNLVYFARSGFSTTVNIGPDTAPETFVFRNNLWYAHDDASRSRPTDLPVAESGGIYGEDPDFVGSSGEYAISPTSPAASSGGALPELVGDITGHCYGNPPSIGAYEPR